MLSGSDSRSRSFVVLAGVRHEFGSHLDAQLTRLYSELDVELAAALGPECAACGDCCRFAEWGHELRLTQLELWMLLARHGRRQIREEGVCPYLQDGRCSARAGRALGCRVFFCGGSREGKSEVQEKIYSRFLQRIRALAAEHGLEVDYGEILESLGRVDDYLAANPQTKP